MKLNYCAAVPACVDLSRRRFVTGVAAGACVSLAPARGAAASAPGRSLHGNQFDLVIHAQTVNFTGQERVATVVNNMLPAPTLKWRAGERVKIRVHNRLDEPTSIHWHGILVPTNMDGVPGLSFAGIAPGTTFTYEFDVRQAGTYWYHSHSGFQEQLGLYGALVIEPRAKDPIAYDRDYVVVLSDWSDESPASIYAKLKKESHYYNVNRRTVMDLWHELDAHGIRHTLNARALWNLMRMNDRDVSDVTAYTYTYLMNGRSPAQAWEGLFNAGERVRLRFINAAAMTFFDVRIPGLKMQVVAADGQYVEAVTVEEFRLGSAETYDIIVTPHADRPYTVFAQAIDRSGYAVGALTPQPGLRAAVPPLDPPPVLSHADMGHLGMQGETHRDPRHVPRAHHDRHVHHEVHAQLDRAGMGSSAPLVHAGSEFGPNVDMRTTHARGSLNDPGVGLRANGRRVLCYADLKNFLATPDPREPTRELQLHLTGNMHRYQWSFDGLKFADAEPLVLGFGERLRITLVNDTMMNHPIHLHGLWSDLETGVPECIPRKHTVIVQPGAKVSYLVSANARGAWAYHCHLLYHMLGMFRVVVVK